MTARTPADLAIELIRQVDNEMRPPIDDELIALAEAAYLLGKHDGWDEGCEFGRTNEAWGISDSDNPYTVREAATEGDEGGN